MGETYQESRSAVLQRQLHALFDMVEYAEGNYLTLKDGRKIFDASGGAAVSCLGHGDERVNQAMINQLRKVSYCGTIFFTTQVCEDLARELVNSTHGHMSRAYLVNSGSEAMEAAMKIARQFFLEKQDPEPQRTHFISRNQSYHGTTLGSLSMGGHVYRRAKFEPMLVPNISKVSPCYTYRGKKQGETDDQYVDRLASELDQEFQRVGPERVCAFVAEPVVGAALGCVPPVPGYFKAMQAVCQKYGALLILDEVMSGMGRTGTLHAWEQEGIVPDIQTIGKCLGGGYQAIAGVLLNNRVVHAFEQGTGAFVHGHTYQGHPIGCAAALAVQTIIREERILANVRAMGELLGQQLHNRLDSHSNVGDIRGRGLFWGIEFVADKNKALPFPATDNIAMKISERSLTRGYEMTVYPGAGTYDGVMGDHIIIAPSYIVTEAEIQHIVGTVSRLVEDFFPGNAS